MDLLILIFAIIAGVVAKPQGYNLTPPFGPSLIPRTCSNGQVLHVDGRCVTPRVNRRVFLYDVPRIPTPSGPPPFIPAPTVETNLLFIRTPEGGQGPDPIVIPPPHQENVVYVLNKQSKEGQTVIEIPAPPSDPEVYFVNYAEGENPTLPSGVDLQTALNAASDGGGQVLGGFGDNAIGVSFGSSNGFQGNNGFGGSPEFGVSNGFGGSPEFEVSNGFGGSPEFEVSNGFGGSPEFGVGNGFGGSNGFEGVVALKSNTGFGGGSFSGGNGGFSGFEGSSGFGSGFGRNAGFSSRIVSSSLGNTANNGHLSFLPEIHY